MLINVFGPLHRPVGIRHALYTFAAVHYPHRPCRNNFEYHKKLGLRTLARKLRSTETIGDEDIYGAELLLSSLMSNNGRDRDVEVVATLFISLFRRYRETSPSKSEIFIILLPSIIDFVVKKLSSGKIHLPSALTAILRNWPTTFSERVNYHAFYRRASCIPDIWQGEVVEAVSLTASKSVDLLLSCVRHVGREMISDFKTDDLVESVLECVANDLTDLEFLNALEQMNSDITTTEGKLAEFGRIETRCALLLLKLLKARTVLEALSDPTLASEGAELARRAMHWWDYCNSDFPFKFKTGIPRRSRMQIIIGGCVSFEERKSWLMNFIDVNTSSYDYYR